jgi:hypothetical protein
MIVVDYEPYFEAYFARTSTGGPDFRARFGLGMSAPQDSTARSVASPPAIMVLRPAPEVPGVSTSSERLLKSARSHTASTAPHTGRGRDWVDSFRAELSIWTTAVDTDDAETSDADAALNSMFDAAGVEAFVPLYDLLTQGPPLTPQELRTFFRALGRSTVPVVVRYRDPLIRVGLRLRSTIARDAAAMAIYDSRQRGLLPELRTARDIEPNVNVRRSMSDILRIFG